MLLKKSITSLCAALVFAAAAVVPCAAAKELKIPEADANGVYGQAGIVWMVMDQWDHRKDITLEPTDEKETVTLDGTYKDVNITGNGEYTVEMSGYHIEDDWIEAGAQMGYLGVELTLNFDECFDEETYEGVTFEVTKAVIDGTEYTFTNNIVDDAHEQVIEPPEISADGQRMIKIKNGYGKLPEFCTPALNNDVWKTTDPLTITFKVSGLPTDKIEGYADEVIEKVYGNGTIDGAADESSVEEASSSVEESKADESVTESKADSSKADTASTDSSSSSDKEESSNTGLIIGIVCAAVVVIAVVAVVIKKKS